MSLITWLVRCSPGISTLLLLILIECALQIVQTSFIGLSYPTFLIKRSNPVFAQALLICYSLLLHVLSLAFSVRLVFAVCQATSDIDEAHLQGWGAHGCMQEHKEMEEKRFGGQEEDRGKVQDRAIFAILIPSYKEDIHVLEETLRNLACHELARSNYDIFLAMEERDPNAMATATTLIDMFASSFSAMQSTIHPGDLPGKAPGKSSNISWAARAVQEKYHEHQHWRDVLVTVMDSDTHLLTQYFRMVRDRHLHKQALDDALDMTLYMPPIVFDRNADQVPCLVRMADLMWCGAGLGCYIRHRDASALAIPTAVYTLPLSLVRLVGGWDTGPGAIGEDMHMMLKCYFATNGRLAVECIPSPASQYNISTDSPGIRGYLANHRARYTQALRHMWGCLDTGFAMTQWFKLGGRRSRTASPQHPPQPPRPRAFSNPSLEIKLSQVSLHGARAPLFTRRTLTLFTRIFEAHFLPSHLTVVIIASSIYSSFTAPPVHCHLLTLTLSLTNYIRILSFAIMVVYFAVCYERYHSVCVRVRKAARISGARKEDVYVDGEESSVEVAERDRWNPRTWIDYLAFPVAGMVFGAVPLVHASFAHFGGDRLVYTVAQKPKRKEKEEGREDV